MRGSRERKRAQRTASRSAAAVVAALAFYLVIGHGSHASLADEGALHGLGICLIMVTFVAALLLPLPGLVRRPVARALAEPIVLARSEPPIPDGRARASPAWIARFLS